MPRVPLTPPGSTLRPPAPGQLSDEVELYHRTYTTLLRSSGETLLRVLESAHRTMGSSLHPLAASDEPAVHAGYSRYRLPLVRGGVSLYELRPEAGAPQPATDAGKSSGVSLHAKAIVVDARKVFIGSMNMDARSRLLNTEMGIVVDNPSLAAAVIRFFDTATSPANAWHVTLQPGKPADRADLLWEGADGGRPVSHDSDPDVTTGRKAEVGLIKLLPVESLL